MNIEVSVPGLPDDGGADERVEAPDSAAASAFGDIREILDAARGRVKKVVNDEMVMAYWDVGRRIVETQGERAAYGKQLLRYLAQELTDEFGAGFRESNLRNMRQFHLVFPNRYALRSALSWTHYRALMRVASTPARVLRARGRAVGVECTPARPADLDPVLRTFALDPQGAPRRGRGRRRT